jgi:sialate O-acetylesterase
MRTVVTYLILIIFISTGSSQEWNRIIDLRGIWKFSIGDESTWAKTEFDDKHWEDIFIPSPWEDEGFPGYDGYAWYRKQFRLPSDNVNKDLYIHLGNIDDVDEVYLNGHLIGFSGSFPPLYYTAYHLERIYRLPIEFLNFSGANIISVRVFDAELIGGIVRGKIGIYERSSKIILDIPLQGTWRFAIGDDEEWKEFDYNDYGWKAIMVPGQWEIQGYKDYDGFAWYRKRVFIPSKFKGQKLILMLGKIDDLDETYVNGNLVGKTGRIYDDTFWIEVSDEWLQIRAYTIDPDDINFGRENMIAVRVFDGLVQGGIYDGPVGITAFENYRKWNRAEKKRESNFFEKLFKF